MKDRERFRRAVHTLEKLLEIIKSLQNRQCTHFEAGALRIVERELRVLHGFILKSMEKSSEGNLRQIAIEQFDIIAKIAYLILSAFIYKFSLLAKVI